MVNLVRITRAGDGQYQVGTVITLVEFINVVKYVLENGGEMPTAVSAP